ncbi:MAG TPA: DUF1572 family protein [Bacteroidota bacterium]|nr:DUF1572 family protein [Bacteroidota bacterium]
MRTGTNPIESASAIFKHYKELADKGMAQISDEEFFRLPEPESNSIAIIVKHVGGNLLSRWTDFLTTDGEKEWRNRDGEFEMETMDRRQLMQLWERGWQALFSSLGSLTGDDTGKIVTIRGEPHSVLEATNRSLAHISYHVGQIVLLAKMYRSAQWQNLTVPKKKSRELNEKMMGAKAR